MNENCKTVHDYTEQMAKLVTECYRTTGVCLQVVEYHWTTAGDPRNLTQPAALVGYTPEGTARKRPDK